MKETTLKKTLLATALVTALAGMQPAHATNWLTLQNNEPPATGAYKFWGFIQPQYVYNEGGAVNGLKGAAGITSYNGKTPVFNLVAPDQTDKQQAQIFRARAGVRGNLADKKINYFLLAEAGNNGLTRADPVVFSDATITFNYIPGARIRVGLGRLPLGEEAMTGVLAMDYINFTNATDNLLNERFVVPYSNTTRSHNPILGLPLKSSQLDGGVGGFRDIGIEAYDWFTNGRWEYSYALMGSNGTGANWVDSNGGYDVSGRLQASYLFGGKGPKREDVSVYVWHQEGKRDYGGTDYNRMRQGIGFKYLRSGIRLSGEYMRGKGMIFFGPNPPFTDLNTTTAFEPVILIAPDSSNKADGYYLDAGWRFARKWEADLRYDYFDRLSNSSYDERKFTTTTIGLQYFYSPTLRVAANYEIRNQQAPGIYTPGATGASTAATQTQLSNANAIADSLGNRISVQATWTF
jgi:hypothetical protein